MFIYANCKKINHELSKQKNSTFYVDGNKIQRQNFNEMKLFSCIRFFLFDNNENLNMAIYFFTIYF